MAQCIREIMTPNPWSCSPEDTITAAARLMVAGNFGALPVVDPRSRRLLGIVTDRDVTSRIVAVGYDPNHRMVRDAMSSSVATLGPDATVHDCVRLMEVRQVRRVPVVDHENQVVGIVAQADLARAASKKPELEHDLVEMVETVSDPPALAPAK